MRKTVNRSDKTVNKSGEKVNERKLSFAFFHFFSLFFTFFHFLSLCLYASFSDTLGIRNSALGKSGVASVNDVTSVLVNPAGLAYVRGQEYVFEYQKPFLGTNEPAYDVPGYYKIDISKTFFGFGLPLPKDIGDFSFYYSGLESKNLYSESTYAFCYARTLEEIFLREKEEEFSLGVALKHLTVGYEADEYTEEFFEKYGSESNGFAVDFGIRYSPYRKLDFGLSFVNIFSSDLGLVYENKPEKRVFFGSAYRLNEWMLLSLAGSHKSSYPEQNVHFGSEMKIVKNLLDLRLGANMNEITAGFGFSFNEKEQFLKINYAFSLPLHLEDSYGTHGMSFSFELPPLVKPSAEESEAEAEAVVAEKESKAAEAEPKAAEAEPKAAEAEPEAAEVEPKAPEVKPVSKKIDVKKIMRKHYNKGLWHLQRQDDVSAIKEFEAILKYEPDHKPSLIRIAAAKERIASGKKKETMKYHWKRGVKYFQNNKYEDARNEFMQILKVEPSHEPSKKRIEIIDKLLKKE